LSDTKETGNAIRLGIFIIANAIVWGAVMIGVSLTVKGSGYMEKIIPIMGAGAGFSVIILPAILMKNKR